MILPMLNRIEQSFEGTSLKNVSQALRDQFEKLDIKGKIKPGQKVAIAVGSRGLNDLIEIVKATIEFLKNLGTEPFIIPAMGSHGGATGKGQTQVLNELGVAEFQVGVPVVSSMGVVSLGRRKIGTEVFIAKDALEADHLVVINRVKPHTAFRGEVESGLCKILAVGCGEAKGGIKHAQAWSFQNNCSGG
jgi:uncharacterized protein (DUF362 family)